MWHDDIWKQLGSAPSNTKTRSGRTVRKKAKIQSRNAVLRSAVSTNFTDQGLPTEQQLQDLLFARGPHNSIELGSQIAREACVAP